LHQTKAAELADNLSLCDSFLGFSKNAATTLNSSFFLRIAPFLG